MFARSGVRLEDSRKGCLMVHQIFELSLVDKVKSKQHIDQSLMELNESVLGKLTKLFSLVGDGVFMYQGRLSVPNVDSFRNLIFEEAHGSRYSIHSGLT